MTGQRRPAPEPLDVDVVSVVILGTAIWFVAFLVLLPLHGRLDDAGHSDWIWTSLAGWTLGLVGIVVARAQRAARHAAERAGSGLGNGPTTGDHRAAQRGD